MPHLYQTENWRLWNRWESTHWFFTPENISHRIYVHTVFTTRIRCCRQLGTKNLGQLLMVCVYMVYRITNILSYIWISTAPGIECRWPSIDKKPLFLHSTCVIGMLSQFCLGIAQIVSTKFSTFNIKSAIIVNRQPISMSLNILQVVKSPGNNWSGVSLNFRRKGIHYILNPPLLWTFPKKK